MSFNYNEIRVRQHSSGTQWASYSDLFMVLAFVFLLMYTVSTLRTGMVSLTSHAEIEVVKRELEVYESVKENYLAEQSSHSEKEIYQEIIDKIGLLEDQATAEKDKLMQQAQQHAARESSLNQYQQLLVAMVNANTIAKAEAAEVISTQQQENQDLRQTLAARESEQQALEASLSTQTSSMQAKISELSTQHDRSQAELAELAQQLSQESAEKAALQNASVEEVTNLEQKYTSLKGNYEEKLAEIAFLADNINADKTRMADLEKNYADKLNNLESQYSGLKDEYESHRDKVARLQAELVGTQSNLQNATQSLTKAESELAATSEELQKSLELANYRQAVAQRISKGFDEAGIEADVNVETGEVILGFGDEYFDTNSHHLKAAMKDTIRDAMPVYADSLFGSKSLTADISAIEIIGFASPTFAGKPVNPRSLSSQNRTAVNYNLNLSYQRARSIFEYAFNAKSLQFEHQETMLPLVKVTGRSFFTEQVNPEDAGSLSQEEFCQQYNCSGSQRVIIKFELKQKENS